MLKKSLFILGLLCLFISCSNLNSNSNNLCFSLGDEIANEINRTITVNDSVKDDSELSVVCQLLNGKNMVFQELSKKYLLKDLSKVSINFQNIPYDNYYVSLKIYTKDILIFEAMSEKIIVNEKNNNVELKLNIKQHNSKIAYELNGGQFADNEVPPTEYFIYSTAKLSSPKCNGFKFMGWYTNKEFTGEPITELGQKNFIGDVKLYAKWTLNQVTNLSYRILSDGINLIWTNPASSTLSKVVISSTDSTFTPIELTESKYLSTSAPVTYKVTTVDSSKQSYVFNIKVVDSSSLESSPASITAYYPVITKFSIPDLKKSSGLSESYTVNITGEHLNNVNPDCFTLTSTLVEFKDNKKITIASDTEMSFDIVTPESSVIYINNVTLSYFGNSKQTSFMVVDYDVGDIALSNGTFVAPEKYTASEGIVPVAVICRPKLYRDGTIKPALGVGLKQSDSPLKWVAEGTPGFKKVFSGIGCTNSGSMFEGDIDGSNNWDVICGQDATGTSNAATNYPAFNWVNNYVTSTEANLSGTDYTAGWYMPSIAELSDLFEYRVSVNKGLEAVGGTKLTSGEYWSSSQKTDTYYPWSLDLGTGTILDRQYGGDLNVCCIRAFN